MAYWFASHFRETPNCKSDECYCGNTMNGNVLPLTFCSALESSPSQWSFGKKWVLTKDKRSKGKWSQWLSSALMPSRGRSNGASLGTLIFFKMNRIGSCKMIICSSALFRWMTILLLNLNDPCNRQQANMDFFKIENKRRRIIVLSEYVAMGPYKVRGWTTTTLPILYLCYATQCMTRWYTDVY
jgi:hypothetical protein